MHPQHPDLIRVALMNGDPGLRELFERSGSVRVVDDVADVLVWRLAHDADGLPSEVLAALADPSSPGVVAVADGHPIRWFQEALRLGVDDVLCLPQSPESLAMAAAKARAAAVRRSAAEPKGRADRGAHVFTVFSTKGGTGRTVVATNLAACLAQAGLHTLLADLDLHVGDDALVLGVAPHATVVDLVTGTAPIDAARLARTVVRHPSGIHLLAAPTRPEDEELVTADRLGQVLETAAGAYDAIVIDAAASFSAPVLLALDRTDTLLLVGALDVPAVRSVRIALQTIELLGLDLPDVRVLMNRAGADVGLDISEIEAVLGREIDYTVPSDRAVPLWLNRGRPVTGAEPDSPAARALAEIGRSLVAAVGRRP
jgi:pilus assembly protein CpaE